LWLKLWLKIPKRIVLTRFNINFITNKIWYDLKDHSLALKQWISIRNIIIYLETKICPNRRIFVFWWPFWIQNVRHSKPKWSPYGAACLTPCKYPFPLKSFNFWIFNNLFLFFYFYIGGHFENFKNKEHNFEWWSIFVSSFKRILCTVSV
jgi:hypothetical protein